jgi:dienelactone hydrolase
MGARLAAAAVILRWLGLRSPWARRPATRDAEIGGATGRLWLPAKPGPGLVLAAGVTPQGNDDPRLHRLADAVARSGWVVFSPALGLAERRLDPDDVRRIADAVVGLHASPSAFGNVSVLGFSFGGSYALVAAADPRLRPITYVVGAFGAYADLANLLPQVHDADDEVVRRLLDEATGQTIAHDEREAVERVLLGEAGLEDLPSSVATRLAAVSPLAAAAGIRVPVSLVHAVDDPVIPVREVEHLSASLPDARVHTVHVFTHVDFRPTPRRVAAAVSDLRALHRFAAEVLGPRRRPRSV